MEAKARTKRKKSGGGKIVPLSMRTTAEIRQRMEKAAEANGRSLASEVEDRLLSSFNQDDMLEAMFGNAELINLFRILAASTDIVERRTGNSWTADYETFVAVRTAWKKLIDEFCPIPAPKNVKAARKVAELDPGPPPENPKDNERWQKRWEIYRAELQENIDHWNEIERIGEQAADESMFPPPQGNG